MTESYAVDGTTDIGSILGLLENFVPPVGINLYKRFVWARFTKRIRKKIAFHDRLIRAKPGTTSSVSYTCPRGSVARQVEHVWIVARVYDQRDGSTEVDNHFIVVPDWCRSKLKAAWPVPLKIIT